MLQTGHSKHRLVKGKLARSTRYRSPHVCFCILSHTDISFTLWHHWYMARVCRRGVPRIFHRGPRLKGRRLRAGVGFLEGQQPHPHPLGGMGSAVSSTAGFGGGAPTAQRFSTIFNTQDGLSWHYNIVNNVDYHAAVGRGKTPVPPAYAPARVSHAVPVYWYLCCYSVHGQAEMTCVFGCEPKPFSWPNTVTRSSTIRTDCDTKQLLCSPVIL